MDTYYKAGEILVALLIDHVRLTASDEAMRRAQDRLGDIQASYDDMRLTRTFWLREERIVVPGTIVKNIPEMPEVLRSIQRKELER